MSNGYFPVPDDAFASALPKTVGDYLVTILNWLWDRVATHGLGYREVYANGDTGDDDNDGLTPATAKKTLQAVFDMVPRATLPRGTDFVIHLRGTFTDVNPGLIRPRQVGSNIIICGGHGLHTTVADDSGDPWTADISSTSSIGLSTAGWTPDEYAGYWVEILSGAAAGQTRLIRSHDGTTITPARNFTVDPGAARFRIVRPTTEIAASVIQTTCIVQNLYFSGSAGLRAVASQGLAGSWTRCISAKTSDTSAPAFDCRQVAALSLSGVGYDTNSYPPVFQDGSTTPCMGLSHVGTAATGFRAEYSGLVQIITCYFKGAVELNATLRQFIGYGTRLAGGLSMWSTGRGRSGWETIEGTRSGYPNILIEGTGLSLTDAGVRIEGAAEISNSSGNGITLDHSSLRLTGVVTGSSNTAWGCLLKNMSVLLPTAGQVPTLTGSSGEVTLDGSTAVAWSTINSTPQVMTTGDVNVAKTD